MISPLTRDHVFLVARVAIKLAEHQCSVVVVVSGTIDAAKTSPLLICAVYLRRSGSAGVEYGLARGRPLTTRLFPLLQRYLHGTWMILSGPSNGMKLAPCCKRQINYTLILVHHGVHKKMMSHVTASCCRSLNTVTEVEEPAKMGKSLMSGAHRHRSILPPGVIYDPRPRVLRRILSNRS